MKLLLLHMAALGVASVQSAPVASLPNFKGDMCWVVFTALALQLPLTTICVASKSKAHLKAELRLRLRTHALHQSGVTHRTGDELLHAAKQKQKAMVETGDALGSVQCPPTAISFAQRPCVLSAARPGLTARRVCRGKAFAQDDARYQACCRQWSAPCVTPEAKPRAKPQA